MSTDKRIIRTQRAIRQAFELLIAQHPLSEITVKRLTDTAGINRKTFYLHYDSIDNLLDAYVTEISNHLVAILKERPFDDVIQEQNGYFFDHLISLFNHHYAFARTILSNDDYSQFTQRITRNVTDQLADILANTYHFSAQDAAIIAHFLTNNTLSILQLSRRKPGLIGQDQLRNYVIRLNKSGLSSFI